MIIKRKNQTLVRLVFAAALGAANASGAFAGTGLEGLSVTQVGEDANGRRCPYNLCEGEEETPVENTCDDATIAANLTALRNLNIVTVSGLAPFRCHGYCFTAEVPDAIEDDKCEKAAALAQLVKLAAPLRVPVRP